MTPASALEVVTAKIAPLSVLLMGMTGLALTVARLVFHVPFRGSLVLLITACAYCVLTGIGIGTFVATMARSATQAQLMLFFVNPPLMALSGGLRRSRLCRSGSSPSPI
jgi:ABC-2 type transport system permease protein